MPRFITVTVGCDWPECDTVGEDGGDTVVSKTLAADGKQAKTFLICKKHLDDLDEIVLPLLSAGSKPEAPRRNGGIPTSESENSIDCKACGRFFKNGAGMAQHVQRSHSFESYAAYKLAYDITD